MVGVLADNYSLYFVKRTEVEGVENQLTWWIARCRGILLLHKACEIGKIGFVELGPDVLLPRRVYSYVHYLSVWFCVVAKITLYCENCTVNS